MEINTSQINQNFTFPKVELAAESAQITQATQDNQENDQLRSKEFPVPADIKEQASAAVRSEQIESAVSQLSEFVQTNNRQLNFSVDEGSNKQVVKVTDAQTGDVIRQIPTEEVLKLSERLQDLQTEVGTAVGLLFNKEV